MREIPVGLCENCRHATAVRSSRGAVFYRCGLAGARPGFARYPRLPVERCDGYETAAEPEPGERDAT